MKLDQNSTLSLSEPTLKVQGSTDRSIQKNHLVNLSDLGPEDH